MDLEVLKTYLQNYFNSVLNTRYSKITEEKGMGPIEFTLYDIIKGSYQPPIFHIFLDSVPMMKKSHTNKPWAIMFMSSVEDDIKNFMKALSINFPIKIHWNKRPIFKNATLSADY